MSKQRWESDIEHIFLEHGVFDGALLLEEVIDAIEADDHIIVHKTQVKSYKQRLDEARPWGRFS